MLGRRKDQSLLWYHKSLQNTVCLNKVSLVWSTAGFHVTANYWAIRQLAFLGKKQQQQKLDMLKTFCMGVWQAARADEKYHYHTSMPNALFSSLVQWVNFLQNKTKQGYQNKIPSGSNKSDPFQWFLEFLKHSLMKGQQSVIWRESLLKESKCPDKKPMKSH